MTCHTINLVNEVRQRGITKGAAFGAPSIIPRFGATERVWRAEAPLNASYGSSGTIKKNAAPLCCCPASLSPLVGT